jgi:glycosyltransferase involved in cell wall biosynthesis
MTPDTQEAALSDIQILLALYNGVTYLNAQLESLAAQTHGDWTLLVSDDSSGDAGPDMVRNFAAQHSGKVTLIDGPGRGASANFMHLLQQSDPEADYLAFCDQDDVWLPHKLDRAIAALADLPADLPALYCSRTLVCDATLNLLYPSRAPRRALTFRNALVQNVVAGNTIVMNHAAAGLARRAAASSSPVAAHDWWLYQFLTGIGGRVIYDDEPSLHYRQHGGNEIGAHHGLQAGLSRITQVFRGRYRRWNDLNVAALNMLISELTPENRKALDSFAKARRTPLPRRLTYLWQSGAYRQSRLGNAALWVSAMLWRL